MEEPYDNHKAAIVAVKEFIAKNDVETSSDHPAFKTIVVSASNHLRSELFVQAMLLNILIDDSGYNPNDLKVNELSPAGRHALWALICIELSSHNKTAT